MLNFNVAVPFPSGACGSLGCHSVASPPRGRPWRLSPLVVLRIISMSVIVVLLVTSSNVNSYSCISLYYVLILLIVLLYRTLRPMIFIPRFAEICGPTSICGSARALYRALVRPEGRASLSDFSAGTEDLAPGRAWHKVSRPLFRFAPKSKDSSLLCPKPHRGYNRQRAGGASLERQCGPAET